MFTKAGTELKFHNLWLATGYALVLLVVFLSLTSVPVDLEMSFPYQDKVAHGFAYFTLMVWFSQIYHRKIRLILIALLFVVMGVVLEYLQSFDPSRYAEYGDMLANATGVVLGFIVSLTQARYSLLKIESLFN